METRHGSLLSTARLACVAWALMLHFEDSLESVIL